MQDLCPFHTVLNGSQRDVIIRSYFLFCLFPSPVSLTREHSLLSPTASRNGSRYRNMGVENVPWLESSPVGKDDPHWRNSRKMHILLVLLLCTIQPLGVQGKPKDSNKPGVVSTATETLPSPSSSSLQNTASEETTLDFDDPDELSVTTLMSLGNRSVQTLRHP